MSSKYFEVDDLDESFQRAQSRGEESSDSEEESLKLQQNILFSLSLQELLFNQSLIKEEQRFLRRLRREYKRKVTKMVRKGS